MLIDSPTGQRANRLGRNGTLTTIALRHCGAIAVAQGETDDKVGTPTYGGSKPNAVATLTFLLAGLRSHPGQLNL